MQTVCGLRKDVMPQMLTGAYLWATFTRQPETFLKISKTMQFEWC